MTKYPTFQVIGDRRCGAQERYLFPYHNKDKAIAKAAEWMATGKYNGVAVVDVTA